MPQKKLQRLTVTVVLMLLGLIALVARIHPGEAEHLEKKHTESLNQSSDLSSLTIEKPVNSQVTAEPKSVPEQRLPIAASPDQAGQTAALARQFTTVPKQIPSYWPKQAKALIDPTNYGERFTRDIHGKVVNNQLIVVLHETVGPAIGTINFFRTPHSLDHQQTSYHALITLDGTIVYLVPPEKRAFGAGNSIFAGLHGPETVQTKPGLPPSVNNFAYHIALETPPDGENDHASHSGYTEVQYQSLAWLVARTNVADSRITTHKAVDQSGERQDPRSFDFLKFLELLHTYPRPGEVAVPFAEPPAS
jgi:hypothetical protein